MLTSNKHSGPEAFQQVLDTQIANFGSARVFGLLRSGRLQLSHYHSLLLTLFHQTQSSPYTFATAAANCTWTHETIKEYLLCHAEEERTHWRWVIDDLRTSGYAGPDPRSCFPHPSCEAYISFNERIAHRQPVARLAIASVLEGIGAHFGATYGHELLKALRLPREHATFFLSHGETDKRHANELRAVIAQAQLNSGEWAWMTHCAAVAGSLYRNMYDHEAFQSA